MADMSQLRYPTIFAQAAVLKYNLHVLKVAGKSKIRRPKLSRETIATR